MTCTYNMVASTNQSTVVAEYISDKKRETEYQSEADLEREFINLLSSLGYDYKNRQRKRSYR